MAPTMEDLKKAEELYTILRPMGDATDEMHSSSVTANLVVLVTTQAYRSNIFTKFYIMHY